MSTPGAVTRRRAARHQAVIRRRRFLLAASAALVGVLAIVLIAPLARQVYDDEFGLPLRYQDVIVTQAREKHLDPALVAAVIYAETKFDPRRSSAGAQGPMQIMPQTAEFLAHRSRATTFKADDLGTPSINIAYGSYYLRYLLDEFGGNLALALAAYNGGEANVMRWLSDARHDHRSFTVSDIPFPETQAYVRKVLRVRREYRRRYAAQLGYA